MLTGALAAAATPLRDGGSALDPDAFGPMTEFLAAGGVDGILALGTTGEGILLSPDERKQAARLFVDLRPDGIAVAVHCGAQTTAGDGRARRPRRRDRGRRGRGHRSPLLRVR